MIVGRADERKTTKDEGGSAMAIAIGGVQELSVDLLVRTRTGRVFQATEGMPVLGADGVRVGHLKQARLVDVLVDRALRRDVYVPIEAIADVTSDGIVLTIPADQVDRMNWSHPSLI
jgi:hypothetical protein